MLENQKALDGSLREAVVWEIGQMEAMKNICEKTKGRKFLYRVCSRRLLGRGKKIQLSK